MSIATSGVAGSYFYRSSGTVANSGAMTQAFWVKRTAAFTGLKIILSVRPNPEATAHEIVINDPNASFAYRPEVQANFAATIIRAVDTLALNVWTYMALVGSGANLSIKVWDGSAWDTVTGAQTAFAVARERWGDAGAGSHVFTGLYAHIRVWNAALSDAELSAERLSATAVRSSGLVSAHSGLGGSIAAALTGQSGTAYTNGGGATYSTDTPSFSTFSGTIISGDAQMPSESVTATGSRYNRILYSGEWEQAVWAKQGNAIVAGAVAAPAGYGTSKRVRIDVNTGGVYQLMAGVPEGMHTLSLLVRRVDCDFVCLRLMNSGFSSGVQGHFNVATGQWAVTNNFGGHTGGLFATRALDNSWHRIQLSGSVGTQAIAEVFPILASGNQVPAVGRNVDVSSPQLEAGTKATYPKTTQSVVVYRSLASATMELASSTIAVGQSTLGTVTMLDTAGSPWDQHGPITFSSSSTAIAVVDVFANPITDLSGRLSTNVNAVGNGSTTIRATDGSIISSPATLTVTGSGTGVRSIEILTEPGWQGTTGWNVGVYEKHATARFPTTKLFEASGQGFLNVLVNNQSRMVVQVPFSVTGLTAGMAVEVVLENDNVAGSPVDGPGIFLATVI